MSCDTGSEASDTTTFNHRSGDSADERHSTRRAVHRSTHRRPTTVNGGTNATPHATNTRRPEGHTQRHTGRKRGPHLSAPTMDDLADLHALFADPRTWWNAPNHRHTSLDQTRALLEYWLDDWAHQGIGYWVMRDNPTGRFLGAGGIRRTGDILSMRYYIPPRLWHRGYGSYLAASAQKVAASYDAALPIFLASLARNYASCLIADKLGFVVVRRDVDFTADAASRRIYADRAVMPGDIAAYLNMRETM